MNEVDATDSLVIVNRAGGAQRGTVLVVGLVFLALLTLVGVTAFSVATQEERMAGSARDRLRAFEAAESALRECEDYISGPVPPRFSASGTTDPGMYDKLPDERANKGETIVWATEPTRRLSGIADVAEQPRCIVERVTAVRADNPSQRAELPQAMAFAYQVTAHGVGSNRNTVVVLQTTFVRD